MWQGLMQTLDDESREGLQSVMTSRRVPKGQTLFLEGDRGEALHVIVEGHVLVERVTLQGDTVAVAIRGPDDLMGEQALISDERRGATARAVTDLTTQVLARQEFDRLRRELPRLDDLLVRMLDARVREASDLLLEARHHPAELRVRRRIVELHQMFGNDIPLTQSVLATLAGTTRPTANAALQELVVDGTVELRRGGVRVLRPEQLDAGL